MGNAGGGVDCNVIPSFFVTSGSVNVRTRTAMAEGMTAVRRSKQRQVLFKA